MSTSALILAYIGTFSTAAAFMRLLARLDAPRKKKTQRT